MSSDSEALKSYKDDKAKGAIGQDDQTCHEKYKTSKFISNY